MDEPSLEVTSPEGRKRIRLDKAPVTIGRSNANALVLIDDLTSRNHCVIEPVPEGFRVRDLDSRNGTRLNGQPVKAALLVNGDVVQVGRSTIRFVAAAAAVKAPPRRPATTRQPPRTQSNPFGVNRMGAEGDRVDPGIAGDPEQVIRQAADSLPDRDFTDGEIALLNARGQVAHASRDPSDRKAAAEQGKETITILRLLLLLCFRIKASDIHIEAKRDDYQVRIRADGNMIEVVRLGKDLGTRLTAVVKILCDIDIAQRNIIQEGHFSSQVPGRRVDYRVSFAPAMFGQKLVMRILDSANTPLYVWDLQMPDWMAEEIERAIQQESGMVLVCGPTGSGKTTTLYACVRSIDSGERNVVTIEDPVEIQLEGVTQIPVNVEQGNTFASLLKSVLRQDPDAILVGEIRDAETARIAMQAAMTGHLVFSTVHARDTLGTVFRLLDLGMEPYLVAQGLHMVLAQRLVRQLCPYCKTAVKPTDEQLQRMGDAAKGVTQLFAPAGCPRCLSTGWAGRRVVFELLNVNDRLRDVLLKNPNMADIEQTLKGTRFQRLQTSGYQLVAEGVTGFDEVDRAVG